MDNCSATYGLFNLKYYLLDMSQRISKFLLLLTATLLLAGLLWLYIWFNRLPEMNSEQLRTDFRVSSTELIASFRINEEEANARFVEKTIEVEGLVKEITFFNDRYTVLLQGEDSLACIMCDMQEDQSEQLDLIKKGDRIVLKGICKGFLMDAILLNCIIPTNSNE